MTLAVMYGMLGNTIAKDDDHPEDGDDYEGMGRIARLFIYTLRNSIGDVIPPDGSFWFLFENEENYEQEKSLVMLSFLWILWVFNVFYMVIILLNFLIAIVSSGHEDAMKIQKEISYSQKCELNYEYDTIKKFFQIGQSQGEKDIFVIAASFKDHDDENI